MLIYGESNVYRPTEAKNILRHAHQSPVQGGCLLLEPRSFQLARETSGRLPSWYAERGEALLTPTRTRVLRRASGTVGHVWRRSATW